MSAAAALLWLRAATLRAWLRGWGKRWLRARRRGRPAKRGTETARAAARVLIEELGPFVSAAELSHRSPGISRREARKLIDAFRQDYRQAHARIEYRLHWSRAGAVWATDFTKAPCEVADIGRALLVVRDVAGKEALGWSPARGERADVARALLTELFSHHGAPLVLKMDNGSAFIADALQALLDEHGVAPLYSPPETPSYNGTCEAGHTWLKFDAHWAARTHGRERAWAMADVDHAIGRSVVRAARRERTRPIDRRPITAEERARFQRELARARRVWQERLGLADYESLSALDKATLDRKAIPMALENLDYLKVTRRRVTPPIRRKIA